MPVLTFLSVFEQNDGLRIFLLVLILIAVILVLFAGAIAILTFYRTRHTSTGEVEEPTGE